MMKHAFLPGDLVRENVSKYDVDAKHITVWKLMPLEHGERPPSNHCDGFTGVAMYLCTFRSDAAVILINGEFWYTWSEWLKHA